MSQSVLGQYSYYRLIGYIFLAACGCFPSRGLPPSGQNAGQVISWGAQVIPYFPPQTRFHQVTAGSSHTLAVTSSGAVLAWGRNDSGESTVPLDLPPVATVAAGRSHNLALSTNGTVLAWGANNAGQTTVPTNLVRAVAISAGGFHSL